MVYMPILRPKEEEENEDLKVVDSSKNKRSFKKGASVMMPKLKGKLTAQASLQLKGDSGNS